MRPIVAANDVAAFHRMRIVVQTHEFGGKGSRNDEGRVSAGLLFHRMERTIAVENIVQQTGVSRREQGSGVDQMVYLCYALCR